MSDLNGIALGPGSPLLTAAGARRSSAPREFVVQAQLVALLVGPPRRGEPRRMGEGMTRRHPELFDLHAIPNGGARSKAAAGQAKAEGVLASMPDLCLPAPRGPFAGLYVEMKRPGQYGRPEQRATAERLRARGYCVVECQTVQEGLDVVLGYLALPAPVVDVADCEAAYQALRPRRR